MTSRGPGRLARSVAEDTCRAARYTYVNSIGGSALVPRVLRWAVYRSAGFDVQTANIFDHCTFAGHSIHIGADTFVNRGCYLEGVGELRIGARCQIGMGVMFVTSDHEIHDGHVVHTTAPRPVSIGDDCWIGARATILPGAVVADGSVIAAGAVVTGTPHTRGVYGGVPARLIGDTSAKSEAVDHSR